MTRLHQYGLLLLFLIALPLQLQAASRVTFQERPTVAIRQTNRVVVRGELVSVDPNKVVLRTGSGFTAKDVEIDVQTIVTLRSLDGEIQFKEGDGIDRFIGELSSRSDVDIEEVSVADRNETGKPAPVNGGFGAASNSGSSTTGSNSSAMNPVLNGGFGPAGSSNAANNPNSNTEERVIVVCDNCKKEVSVSAEYGQKCPHCGILWDVDAPSSNHQQVPPDTAGAYEAGGHANASPSDGGGRGRPVVAQSSQVPDGSAPPSIHNAPAPVSMENLPLWMKASIFFGCIAVMYYFFFYRA